MKIVVISDSHGNIANLKHVMGFAKKINAKAVIHCGDWNTIESVDEVLSYRIPLYSVIGNADIDPRVSEKFAEEFLAFELGGRKIGVTHKPSDNKKYFANEKLDIIFNGHLHSKFESEWNRIKIIRPGAIINGINFAIFDTASNRVEFVQDE